MGLDGADARRKKLILVGLETIQICHRGYYEKGENKISLSNEQYRDFEKAILYSPVTLEELRLSGKWDGSTKTPMQCRISVSDQDSFAVASNLDGALVMNFANAHRPGGGFLYGAKAQEESLCRASTLYASISSDEAKEMYEYNRRINSPVDSDYMILSPEVCVFRQMNGEFLDEPFYVSAITVPAPDKAHRAVQVPQEELDMVIKNRIRNMLMVASYHGYRSLALGAWGCGVFGNDTREVARCFYDVLATEGYAKYFADIVFAIYQDREKLEIFQKQFCE